ncbi:MAG: pilus assembly protein CpaE [Candidatus Poriferisodalaceae bacterium]|jgi:pilus assembly protein CpaE
MSRVVVLTDDEAAVERLRSASREDTNLIARLPLEFEQLKAKSIVAAIPGGGAMVVVIGPGLDMDIASQVARLLERSRPDVALVLWGEPTSEMLTVAVDVGARGVIAPHGSDQDIKSCVRKAIDYAEKLVNLSVPASSGALVGRVIAVTSPKGGTGKTTVSVNLAIALVEAAPGEVVVVDLDLQFGDVEYALRLKPEFTMADACRSRSRLDVTKLKGLLTSHPSGIYALCAPPSPAEADGLDPEAVATVIGLLASQFRFVILDTSGGIDEHTLAAVDAATDVVLIVSTDVPTVRSAQKSLAVFKQLGRDDRPWHVVLNRADARVGLSAADVEDAIGIETDARVPESRAVCAAMNHGSPIVECQPKSAASKSLVEFASRFLPQAPTRRRWRDAKVGA